MSFFECQSSLRVWAEIPLISECSWRVVKNFKIVSDWKFFIDAICKYNLSYKRISKPLSTFYIGGLSSNPENQIIKFKEKEDVIKGDYLLYTKDINDILEYRKTLNNLRSSRIINLLVKLGFLNKF